MKKVILVILAIIMAILCCACGSNTQIDAEKHLTIDVKDSSVPVQSNSVATQSNNNYTSNTNNSNNVVFTNKYGTSTTKCAHSGCNNYIASSGDTNCCTTHSNRCLQCGKYIDEDAAYCIDCIAVAAEKAANKKGSTVTVFTNKYGTSTTKCAHSGCNNYIASSGDTNCCTTHSKHCLNCGKYIDEDAAYCIDCLATALGQ